MPIGEAVFLTVVGGPCAYKVCCSFTWSMRGLYKGCWCCGGWLSKGRSMGSVGLGDRVGCRVTEFSGCWGCWFSLSLVFHMFTSSWRLLQSSEEPPRCGMAGHSCLAGAEMGGVEAQDMPWGLRFGDWGSLAGGNQSLTCSSNWRRWGLYRDCWSYSGWLVKGRMLGLMSLGSRVGVRDIGEAFPQISHLLAGC